MLNPLFNATMGVKRISQLLTEVQSFSCNSGDLIKSFNYLFGITDALWLRSCWSHACNVHAAPVWEATLNTVTKNVVLPLTVWVRDVLCLTSNIFFKMLECLTTVGVHWVGFFPPVSSQPTWTLWRLANGWNVNFSVNYPFNCLANKRAVIYGMWVYYI